jgi:uncharacterized integral membrane protein
LRIIPLVVGVLLAVVVATLMEINPASVMLKILAW